MVGKYWVYYEIIVRFKMKKYRCLFNSCGYKLPSYQGIVTHIKRTHGKAIIEAEKKAREWREEQERKKQEEIQQRKEEIEFGEQQLREYKRLCLQEKQQNKLKKERQEKQRKIEEGLKIVEEEHRRREEARMTEVWNKAQKETQKQEARRRHKENTRKIFAYYLIFKKENPTFEDFYLSSL